MMTAETLIRILPLEAELKDQTMNQGVKATDPMNPQIETLIRNLPLEADLTEQIMNQGAEVTDPMNLTA
jgi:hypothetical protein